jgi:hypothetical protein
MRKFVLLIVAAMGLSGCVSDQMNQGLGFMVGQNIQYAVSRLGYPDDQRTMLGDTIYVWSTSRNVNLPMTTTSTTYGNVGTTPVYGTTMGTTYVPANFNCTIQLAVGADQTIKSWQWSGNMGGCMQYARRLSQR